MGKNKNLVGPTLTMGAYPTVTHQSNYFLYSRKEHVKNSSFLKYYVPMANFNKVIKVLNIKSAVSLQLTPLKRNRDNSLNAEVNCKLTADFIVKTFITLLKLAIGT